MIQYGFKLDNTFWFALSETNKEYAVEFNGCNFSYNNTALLAELEQLSNVFQATEKYSKLTPSFYMFGITGIPSKNIQIVKQLNLQQMVLDKPFEKQITETIVELKSDIQKKNFMIW